ncbi:ATP synthase mitochondrial F1 complex assembly factor 2-like isoform X2 [Watersipora subatra]
MMSFVSGGLMKVANNLRQLVPVRYSSFIGKDLTKFYKTAHITQVVGQPGYYEINLDTKKLKTPVGNVFQVPGESLALAVAAEWNTQEEKIKRHTMHITSLCNTAIDNPTHRTRSQVVRAICHYLGSDTLCYRMAEPEKLLAFQKANWDPVLLWFKTRYGIELEPTEGIVSPEISEATYLALEKQLTSYTDWTLVGLQQLVECLKSLSLALALCESEIEVQRAVYLSRLESAFQTEQWGSVEWYHDIEMQETQARVAAATLFIHFCHDFSSMQTKHKHTLLS